MAAAAIAVAKFASAAFASATTAVASGLTAMGMSAATATAVATQVVTTAATIAVTTGISYLLRPSTPSSGLTLDFKPDPKAPVTGMMGYAATGGNKVFQSTWGYNNVVLSLGAALSLGPIDAITQFRADDKVVAFTGAQNEAVGFYDDDMWQKTTLGLPTDAALLPPTGLKYGSPGLSGWGANNAAKGVSFAFWTMVLAKKPEDRNIFVNGVPDPRWVGRWMKLYDWRKDSTYPGGSGSHRENDWRTWEFTENPYVHARAWLRGHHKLNDDGTVDFTKRIAGVGVNPAAIDMPAFNEGANVADANNWKISGSWSSSDSKWDTLVSMLKAGSGSPQQNGAMISVLVNTPRVSTETVTRDNIVGDIQINPLTRRRERKNTIVPRYRSEAHSWEYVPAGSVTNAVYRTEDRNELRSLEVQYTYVRDAKQAAQLAAYDLANMRESIKVNATLKVDALSIRAGDCITFNVPEVGLENQKCVVIRKTTDYQTAMVTVECRSETDGKHAWALGQAANPPPTPSLSANDPLYMPPPLPIDWTVTPQPPTDGSSQPIIIVTGPIDRGDIASVIVEYALSADGPWTSAGPSDPATGNYSINGLRPLQQYWISIRYVANNGTISDRYIDGPKTAPDLVAQINPNSPIISDLESEIQDVINNLDDEVTNRQSAISTLKASISVNEFANADLANGTYGFRGTFLDPTITLHDGGSAVRVRRDGGIFDGGLTLFAVVALEGGGVEKNGFRWWPVVAGERIGFAMDSRAVSGTAQWNIVVFWCDKDGNNVQSIGSQGAPYSPEYVRSGWVGDVPSSSDGFVRVEAVLYHNGDASGGTGDLAIRRPTFSRMLSGVTSIPAYNAPVVGGEISSLSASVTQNTTAIVSLEDQFALASWEVVAAASGGKPARLKIASSTLGSFVALDAPYIFFGDNTVFEDATDTLVTTVGSTRYITAWGAPFGPDSLTYWVGPNNIATTAATKANAGVNGQWRASTGASFFGGATLSGPFDTGAASATSISLPKNQWTTIAEVPSKYMAETGYASTLANYETYVTGTAADPENERFQMEMRVVAVDQAGNNPVVIASNFWNESTRNAWQTYSNSVPVSNTPITTTWGDKRIRLQIRPTGIDISTAQARNGRARGIYGA